MMPSQRNLAIDGWREIGSYSRANACMREIQ